MIATLLAVAALIYVAIAIYHFFETGGFRRANEPVIIRGFLPFFGVGFNLAKDAVSYLNSLREKYGEVFTIFSAGRRTVVFTSAADLQKLYSLSTKIVDFKPLKEYFGAQAFGTSKTWLMESNASGISAQSQSIVAKYLQGESLNVLTEKMQKKLENRLFHEGDDWTTWKTIPLYDFITKLIFMAGTDAIIYDKFMSEEDYKNLDIFDSKFPQIASGILPKFLFQDSLKAREVLVEKFKSIMIEKSSEVMRERDNLLQGNANLEQRARTHFSFFWASQVNTMTSVFWSLAYLLIQSEEVKAKVAAEVHATVNKLRQEEAEKGVSSETSKLSLPTFTPEALASMEYTDSIIGEALRLNAIFASQRKVMKAFDFDSETGKKYHFREGDHIFFATFFVNHDPEIYDNPMEFQWDRYVRNKKFVKNGKTLTPNLLPLVFGGGANICPGRFFARNEMRLICALVLYFMDIKFVEKNTTIPPPVRNFGGGITPPEKDVQVMFRLKEQFLK